MTHPSQKDIEHRAYQLLGASDEGRCEMNGGSVVPWVVVMPYFEWRGWDNSLRGSLGTDSRIRARERPTTVRQVTICCTLTAVCLDRPWPSKSNCERRRYLEESRSCVF